MSAGRSAPDAPTSAVVWRYGLVGLPLAGAALPLYLLTPQLYAGGLGLPLAWVGAALMASRLVDGFVDPLLGQWIDRTKGPRFERWIVPALVLLCLGLAALFLPPANLLGQTALLIWMTLAAILVSLANSAAGLAHQAWPVAWGLPETQQARLVSARELLTLTGVILASMAAAMGAPVIIVALVWGSSLVGAMGVRGLPGQVREGSRAAHAPLSLWRGLTALDPRGRATFLCLALNALANAIPATLFLFFVSDALGLSQSASAGLLALYFLCALTAIPLWNRGIQRGLSAKRAWILALSGSVLLFLCVPWLGAEQAWLFVVVCIGTGLCLGAELIAPALLISQSLQRVGLSDSRNGEFFGLWNLMAKLALALAAGGTLPLLDLLGYQPGQAAAPFALGLVYAGLPCLLKLTALLTYLSLEKRHDRNATSDL
ncbi:MFS_MelB_like domain containing protein [Burkholderiales bacterium]